MPSAERQDGRPHAEETAAVPSVLQDKNDLVSFRNVDFTNDLRPNRSGTFSERSPQTLNERVWSRAEQNLVARSRLITRREE